MMSVRDFCLACFLARVPGHASLVAKRAHFASDEFRIYVFTPKKLFGRTL